MELIHNIINDPNFGRLFSGSQTFASVFNRMLKVSRDPDTQDFRKRLTIVVDDDGQVGFRAPDIDYTWRPSGDETPGELIRRIMSGGTTSTDPLDPAARFGFDYIRSSEWITGDEDIRTSIDRGFRFGREQLKRTAREKGIRMRYTTFDSGRQSLDAIYNMVGQNDAGEYMASIRADDSIIRVAEYFDQDNNRVAPSVGVRAMGLDLDQIALTGTSNKRWNTFFNATSLQFQFEPGELTMATFNAKDVYGKDFIARSQAEAIANIEMTRNPDLVRDDVLDDIYSSFNDGQVLVSRERFQEHGRKLRKNFLESNLQRLTKARQDGSISQAEYDRAIIQMNEAAESITRQINAGLEGADQFNFRGVAAVDVLTDMVGGGFPKGDARFVPQSTIEAVLARDPRFANLSKEQLAKIDFIVDQGGLKSELGPLDEVKPFMTFDIVGHADETAYTNTIAAASHPGMYDPTLRSGQGYLMESFDRAWAEQVDQISRGDLGGLRQLMDDIEKLDIADYNNFDERQAVLANKRYARRIQQFIRSGNRLEINDTMIEDMYRIARDHFFRERKFGRTINLGGEDVADLALRIPQYMSTRAHMTTEQDFREVGGYVTDRLSLNMDPNVNAKGAFGLSGADVRLIRASQGGMDLDDALALNNYVYDPQTKRMLAMITRDPTYIGEYQYMDARFGRDRNFAKQTVDHVHMVNGQQKVTNIRVADLFKRYEEIRREIEKIGAEELRWGGKFSTDTNKKVQKLIQEWNEVRFSLDDFLQNEDMIPQVDLAARYALDNEFDRTFAPMGNRVTAQSLAEYSRGSILRGYGQIDDSNIPRFLRRFQEEMNMSLNMRAALPYENVGEDYVDLLTGPGGIGESDLFVDIRNTEEYQRAVSAMEARKLKDAADLEAARIAGNYKEVADQIRRRINTGISESKGLLGRIVNASTVINQALLGNDSLSLGAQSAEEISRWRQIVRGEGRIIYARGEEMIDPITKTGDVEFLTAIEDVLNKNLKTIGRVMGQAGEGYGFDPVTLAQRGGLDTQQMSRVLAGYREVVPDAKDVSDEVLIGRLTLDRDDPRAWVSRLDTQIREREAAVPAQKLEARQAANEKLLKELENVDPTPLQRSRAEEYLDDFYRRRKELTALRKDPDALASMLDEALAAAGDPDFVGDINTILNAADENELNSVMARHLKKWGLFGDRTDLHQQILAIAKLSLEAQDDLAVASEFMPLATEPLMLTTTRVGETSIGELAGEAFRANEEGLLRAEIARAADEFDPVLDSIDDYFKEVINPITAGRGDFVDVESMMNARFTAMQKMREAGGTDYGRTARGIARRLGVEIDDLLPSEMLQVVDRIEALEEPDVPFFMSPREINVPDDPTQAPGAKKLTQRSVGDEVSSQVIKHKRMKSIFDREEIARLLSNPGFRKGLGVAAIFAGLGIIHEVRGERSPEQMAGPPLLPGGSSYEDMPPPPLPRPIAMPQRGNGYTYQVRATGKFDPNSLSSGLQGITGSGVNGTIYNTRETYNPAQQNGAVDVLNMLMEGY